MKVLYVIPTLFIPMKESPCGTKIRDTINKLFFRSKGHHFIKNLDVMFFVVKFISFCDNIIVIRYDIIHKPCKR